MTSILPGPEPLPPGGELAHGGNADLSHAGNVTAVDVEPTGTENARVWPEPPGPPSASGGPPPIPKPVASFTWTPANPVRNQDVTLDASGSTPGDPSVPITSYRWTFTDGTAPKAGQVVTWHTPNKTGSYTTTLRVTASDGQYGSAILTILVR